MEGFTMAGKPKAAAKEFSVTDFNKGHTPYDLQVGERVSIYKIPYRKKHKIGSGIVKRIITKWKFSAYCELLMDGKETTNGHWVYLGRVYEGRDKP
jgi:hypothetical protein